MEITARLLLAEIIAKFKLFDEKVTPDSLTREQLIATTLRLSQATLVEIVNRLTVGSGKMTHNAFTAKYGLNAGVYSQYRLLKAATVKVTNAILTFLMDECGFTDPPRQLETEPMKVIDQIIEVKPKGVLLFDLDNAAYLLNRILWVIPETACDIVVVGFCSMKTKIVSGLLESPWFYLLQPETHAKDAADAALSVFAALLSTKLKTTFLFISGDGFIEETSTFLGRATGQSCHYIQGRICPLVQLLDVYPGKLSTVAAQLKKVGVTIEAYESLRSEFPFLPIMTSTEIIGQTKAEIEEEAKAKREGSRQEAPVVAVNTTRCVAMIRTGDRRGELCGRQTPCDYHSVNFAAKLAKLE